MDNSITKAAQFNLKSAILSNDSGKRTDIRFLTNSITFDENMTDGFISGSMKVFDGTALYNEFPIRGQEFIEFTAVDFDGNEFYAKFSVYAIDNLKPVKDNNDAMMGYTLHFVSPHKLYNESVHIRNAFRNESIDVYAAEVFDGAFKGDARESKPLLVDKTDNPMNIVSPAYNPIATMQFFARKALSNTDKASQFRFWESKTKFHFRNLESIMREYKDGSRKAKKFGVNMIADQSREGQIILRHNIISYDLGTYVNSMNDIRSGLYNRTVLELDSFNRTVMETTYKHLDEEKDFVKTERTKDVHDKDFNDYIYHPTVIMVHKNWNTSFDPYTPFNIGDIASNEVIARKQSVYTILDESAIFIKIHGDFSIEAGDMIEISLPVYKAKTDDKDMRNPVNGKYIIDKIISTWIDDEFYMDCKLIRLGVQEYRG